MYTSSRSRLSSGSECAVWMEGHNARTCEMFLAEIPFLSASWLIRSFCDHAVSGSGGETGRPPADICFLSYYADLCTAEFLVSWSVKMVVRWAFPHDGVVVIRGLHASAFSWEFPQFCLLCAWGGWVVSIFFRKNWARDFFYSLFELFMDGMCASTARARVIEIGRMHLDGMYCLHVAATWLTCGGQLVGVGGPPLTRSISPHHFLYFSWDN